MSIENTLERIAIALEEIAATNRNPAARPEPVAPVAAEEPKKAPGRPKATAPKAAPVLTPEPAVVDPFAPEAAPNAPVAEITFEQLADTLKQHAKVYGTKTTVGLMIKHGADKTTMKISSIPMAAYAACFAEATEDLAKVPGKAA